MSKRRDLPIFVSLILIVCINHTSCKKNRADLTLGSVRVESHLLDPVFPRAEKNSTLTLVIRNTGGKLNNGEIELVLPANIDIIQQSQKIIPFSEWNTLDTKTVLFHLVSHSSATEKFSLKVHANSQILESIFEVKWNPSVNLPAANFAPDPIAVNTGNYLVGAQRCDLWNGLNVWDLYQPNFFDRQPVIGWYREGQPDVTDWEIKYALEHGINFFVHCWYRDPNNFGKSPVQPQYDHVIKSYSSCRYANKIKFAIQWINTQTTTSGISGSEDLLKNILPYWMENYFRNPNYLTIDNKPVLFIYGPDGLIADLGGETNTTTAINQMRKVCIDAGFGGLVIVGNYCWGSSTNPNTPFKTVGMNYTTSYHWPSFGQVLTNTNNPNGTEILEGQKTCWKNQADYGSLPNLITCSMGWDSSPWGGMTSKIKWRLTPDEYQTVLQNAKEMMDKRNQGSIESRMVLLDNWNEYGEGHYVFPTRQYGFGYLDAVRNIFASGSQSHIDIVPEDIGQTLPN